MERRPLIAKSKSRIFTSVFIGLGVLYLVFFMPLPYFVFSPGTADVIKPMVHVKAADPEEKGSFMLTTVRVSDASVFNYAAALLNPYREIYAKSAVFRNGENEQEYSTRQEVVMQTSQMDAIQAAYRHLKIPFNIHNDGVMVLRTLPDYPAAKVLQAGDYIVKVNDSPVRTTVELNRVLQTKKAGNTVVLTYKRKDEEKTANLTLTALPPDKDEKGNVISKEERAGLGVVPANVQSILAEQEDKQVTIQAGEIGGPSAGLMFSLEIYNQLTPGDLTKGYRIAGTGTIDPNGKVGSIGGIQHKVIAADKEGAEIFFAPRDETPETATTSPPAKNYSDANKRAEEIHSKMKIVPVATLDDALKYLEQLPPKI
ncbi:SepM family pheromone-processing serine protease [Paenibacillus hamazuiensis]|uniref:SepM family pheromone-processing serine protease n=1 Tax=Paenibacillus hamazuiensis TaxID=2936508 RepID=UPI00200D2249|nr:SepM family pheromone-processing serine protease [Paenibacillus hamazuiensis]